MFNLTTLIILALTASVAAQKVKTSLPAKVFNSTVDKPQKMLFSGTVNERFFEMTLVRDGGDLRGSYFFVQSGRANALKLRVKIAANGKVSLREFNGANKQTGEFRGELVENTDDYDLTFSGDWKSVARKKHLNFYAAGQIIGFTGERRIEIVYIRERNARRRVELDAAYVQIAGGKSSGTRGFNLAAKRMIVNPIGKFNRMVVRQTADQLKNMSDEINLYSAFSYIKFADDRFVSAAFFYSENSNGMVHTMDGVKSLNYDLEKNRKIKLADLFKPDSKYLETISAYCLKILQSREPVNGEKLADGDWASGAAAKAENFECWNLMKKGRTKSSK